MIYLGLVLVAGVLGLHSLAAAAAVSFVVWFWLVDQDLPWR